MTLTKVDKYAIMRLEDIRPRELGLYFSHNSAPYLMMKDHCCLVTPATC